ncbi:hypothetical protein FACS1894113_4650 [Alphaproteobacteria bacterium]|nr:hypothetical protein FACS1894113_4650 [Alphaproteobacteria bacterium]
MMSSIKTKNGRSKTPLIIRGKTRYLYELTDKVVIASICSVTFIVPISAVIDAPRRPATISAVKTGPSSLVIAIMTTDGMPISAVNFENPE